MKPDNTKVSHWTEWFAGEMVTTKPFAVDGKIAATDGRFAVIANEPAVGLESHSRSSALARLLMSKPDFLRNYSWDAFSAAVGSFPGDDECEECRGNKIVPHVCGCDLCTAGEEDCRECFGTGRQFPDTDCVSLLGHPVDATLLRYMLAHLPPQKEISVGVVTDEKATYGGKAAIFVLRAADWTAFLVGMVNQDGRKLRELLPGGPS